MTRKISNGGLCSCPVFLSFNKGSCHFIFWVMAVGVISAWLAQPAQAAPSIEGTAIRFLYSDAVQAALIAGLAAFSAVTAFMHARSRNIWAEEDQAKARQLSELSLALDQAEVFLSQDLNVMVVFSHPHAEPVISGDFAELIGRPNVRRVLAYTSWLDQQQASALEGDVKALLARGQVFERLCKTQWSDLIQVDGRSTRGCAVLRFRAVTMLEKARIEAEDKLKNLQQTSGAIQALIDALPQPVWLRQKNGQLAYVNKAYMKLMGEDVEAKEKILAKSMDFFDEQTRLEVQASRLEGKAFQKRISVSSDGVRHIFDLSEVPTQNGFAGIAMDVSEGEAMRSEMQRQREAHARTLDQLATSVAVFDQNGRLVFHNAAYQQLWQLDPAFLQEQPTDGMILDRLRSVSKLPQQTDYRGWKARLHEAYRTMETREDRWHLPDGRTLRVVTHPNAQGGVTYLFDDVSESYQLQSRFNALARVQGETLDALQESVAVFGQDGRLSLYNPAFAMLWRFSADGLAQRPHFDDIAKGCLKLFKDEKVWTNLKAVVTGYAEGRSGYSTRMSRVDGQVVDCTAMALPDGGTLITFTDITANVNAEHLLREHNDALEKAAKIRNDFVHHISYTLRSPLTTIIGFAELLSKLHGGNNAGQNKDDEYAHYILSSSTSLLAIIDDILDLATIDEGQMDLHLGPVNITQTIDAAIAGLEDKISQSGIVLEKRLPVMVSGFVADSHRLRQIVFNLLSNAIAFSEKGQTVRLALDATPENIILTVQDEGKGIPAEVIDRVFERFETHGQSTNRHRGVGIGLSIVRAFVELHGGTVTIESEPGKGTRVMCSFPRKHTPERLAA
jgi:signal transduction histidine kinase